MSQLIKPEGYKAVLGKHQTEQGIKLIKEFFSAELSYRITTKSCYGTVVRVERIRYQ